MNSKNNQNPTQPNTQNNNEDLDLRSIILQYANKWHWFVLGILISFLLTFAYLKTTVNKYSIQTTIQIKKESSSFDIESAMLSNAGLGGPSREVEDEIQILHSMKLVSQTIKALNIQTSYFKKDGYKYLDTYPNNDFTLETTTEFYDTLKYNIDLTIKKKNGKFLVDFLVRDKYKKRYTLNSIDEPFNTPLGELKFKSNIDKYEDGEAYRVKISTLRNITNTYSSNVNIATVKKDANIIKLSLVEANANKAINFLNKLVELYNIDAINSKNIQANNTAKFIESRLAMIGEQLAVSESDIESYKKSQNLTDIKSEAAIYLSTASEYNKKITELETQLNLVNSIETYISDPKNRESLIPVNVFANGDNASYKTIEIYNEKVLERMQLAQTASIENPVLVNLDKQLSVLRVNVLDNILRLKSDLKISIVDITKKNREFTNKIKNVPTQERQFLSVKRQQEIKQNVYMFLLQKQEEIALELASKEPIARVVDSAYASLGPVSPKRSLILLIAIIFGLAVPFLIIYIKELFNNTISNKDEFKELVKAPFLGPICIDKETDDVIKVGTVSPINEMFGLIRTNLSFMVENIKSPVILITSTVSGEGKSFTSINLSTSLALTNKKVILLGLDIRNPMLVKYMHINSKQGISLYLSGHIDTIDELIVPSKHNKNLDIIHSGPIPPNPSELLMSSRLDDLIVELKKSYDYIIVDTAPIGMVTDTYLLNRISDMSIYVSRQGYTPKDATNLINEVYENNRLKNVSTVLNGVKDDVGYGYSYGYGKKNSSYSIMIKDDFNDKIKRVYRKLFKKS